MHLSGPNDEIWLAQSEPRLIHSFNGCTAYPQRPPQPVSVQMYTPPRVRF